MEKKLLPRVNSLFLFVERFRCFLKQFVNYEKNDFHRISIQFTIKARAALVIFGLVIDNFDYSRSPNWLKTAHSKTKTHVKTKNGGFVDPKFSGTQQPQKA